MNDDNNNDAINKEVMNAINCLKNTLLKYLKKHNYDNYDNNNGNIPNDIKRILLQMKYCLYTLKKQIISLQCLIQCLIKRLHPILLQQIIIILNMNTKITTNDKRQQEHEHKKKQKLLGTLFQHLFLQIVRIQDSIILCVSGECRHQGNKNIVLKQRKLHPYTTSKLGTNNNNDSSSMLYNPNHIYSGTSWDEYMDTHVGIKTRLIQVLQSCTKKKSITWDQLNEMGTAPLENMLNDIEIQMKHCKDTFIQYCKQQLIKDIKHSIIQKFQNSISFQADLILTDKLEKMNIKIIQNTSNFQFICSLERYGNKFQINDPNGVLPLHYITVDHWWKDNIMKFPSQQDNNEIIDDNNTSNMSKPKKAFKRLRRAIEDTDDDDTSDNDQNLFHNNNDQNSLKSKSNQVPTNNNVTKENGLVVKFQKQEETKSRIDVSVNAIKEQLGIDTKALEISRENLEAEEALTYDNEVDDDDDDDHHDNIYVFISKKKYRIENAMLRMKRLQKVLKNEERNCNNITIIWDARESLREVIMETGNLLLWSKHKHDIHNNDYYCDPMTHTNSSNSNNQKNNNNSITKSNNNNDNNNDQYYYITIRDWIIQSIKHFCCAKVLVMEQQKQLNNNNNNQKMMTMSQQGRTTIDDNENLFLERNLLLLKGRAITNAGIGYIELFTTASYIDVSNHVSSIITVANKRNMNNMDRKSNILLIQAIECFNEAIKDAEELQSKCQNELVENNKNNSNQDKKKKKSIFEIKIDLWKGKELMSLIHRWKAIALWYLSKFDDSYNQFHLAASSCSCQKDYDKNNDKKANHHMNKNDEEADEEIDHAQIDCEIECYYAWTQLSDLCINSLQRGTIHLIRTKTKAYDTIFEYVKNGLHLASKMSTSIHQSFMKLNGYQDNYHIKSSNELLQGLDEITIWWKQKKSCALKQLSSSTNTTLTIVLPMDIVRNDLGEIPKLPTKLYTFYDGSSSSYRQRSKNVTTSLQKNRNYNNNVGGNMNNKENQNDKIVQKQIYRKWGDELLPHQEIDSITGIMKPKLIYPSIAPNIPDKMKFLYEQYLERKKQKNG